MCAIDEVNPVDSRYHVALAHALSAVLRTALRSRVGADEVRHHRCMWIDSHCHLDAPEFDADRAAVVARARAAGVQQIVLPAVEIGRAHV